MLKKRSIHWRKWIGYILCITLIASLCYAVIMLITAPDTPPENQPHTKVRSDYLLMLVQCALALVVMFLPSILDKKWNLAIPNSMYIMYFVFLYCAVYLGEIRNFYFVIPHWDTMLHTFSGAMLGALGFFLVALLNDAPHVPMQLSPKFVALFAFCFALAAGAVWEIYEFTMDSVLGLNMQKYMLEFGEQLVGRAALMDTMKDLIVDALGSGIIVLIGYFDLKKKVRKAQKADAVS